MFEETYLTLAQLNETIRQVLEGELPDAYWVVAEVAEINARRGHCYIQLVDKQDDEVIAQSRATIWSSRAHLLDEFEDVTGETLKKGMEVLLCVRVRFHGVYGLSLDVISLNPVFTLGGMARKRRETIERLAAEGLIDRNRAVPFPAVPQRVAVITSPNAAGLGDFSTHLRHNPAGFAFHQTLFAAAVQGAEAEVQLTEAMREVSRLARVHSGFDVVVILRGGGSQLDLSCFDSYSLAAEIARCPIPVITGIGHEKDESVADMVAHARCKTPTAAAELLIGCAQAFESRLQGMGQRLTEDATHALRERRSSLSMAGFRLSAGAERATAGRQHRLELAVAQLQVVSFACLSERKHRVAGLAVRLLLQPRRSTAQRELDLAMLGQRARFGANMHLVRALERLDRFDGDLRNLDPANVLRRGYSITRLGGKVIKAADEAQPGEVIETELALGAITSVVSAPQRP